MLQAMERSSTFLGSGLLAELRSSDGLSAKEGRDWISKKAARPFDADAMYMLTWPENEDPKTWREYTNLRIHVMSDSELDTLELQYRKRHALPPRRPWEARMFQSSRGRSER
jgi:hypothetical protein